MKKFLFTLAALLMAGSLCAQENYLYVPDFELTQEEATNGVQNKAIFVVAHFDSYVTTIDWTINFPEGVEFVSANMPNSAKPYIYQYVDVEDEETGEIVPTLTRQRMNPQLFGDYPHYITTTSLGATSDQCYSEDGSVCYGAPKWGGDGVEFNFYRFVINIAPGFEGGDITVHTEPACTDDPRGNTCPKNSVFDKVNAITVEGGVEPIVTEAPEIVVTAGDDAYTFDVVGPEGAELKLFVDGVEVEIPYTVARTDVDQIVKLTATAHIEGQTDGTVTGEYLVPALVVPEPQDLTGEIVIGDPDENGNVVIDYTGDEDVTIVVTVNGEVVEVVDGVITVGEGENEITVTVTAEGYNDLTETVTVVYEPTPEPQPTATPTIKVTVYDTEVVISAEGEGEVILMIDGEVVDNPTTIARGEEDVVVTVTATAQAEGQLISETAEEVVTIPAYVDDPEGHMTGYWVVLYDKDNNEVWQQLPNANENDPNQYVANVALHYSQFGGKPLSGDMTDADNPMVPFYFMINGVRYACADANVEPNYGNANENPLFMTDNCWNVPVGYFYTIGVLVDPETNDLYMQISKGLYTGIEELNGDKAVAGVRYFNMAGQEMQEANGMTIVVTTYTDGTTSAVKVMK